MAARWLLTLLTAATLSGLAPWARAQEYEPDADLTELSIEELMDLEISVASRRPEMLFEAPAVVVVVPRSEFEVYGDRTLVQLLQRQPSIYTRSSYAYLDTHAAFRGDLSNHVEMHTLVLLNGRPIRDSAQALNFSTYMTFPIEALESVELIRGPGSVLYGTDAFTGVIDLKTRPVPEKPEISIFTMGGSYGYYDTTITGGGKHGDLGVLAAIRVAGQDGFPYRVTDWSGVSGEADKWDRSVSGLVHLDYRDFTLDVFGSDIEAFHLGVTPDWSTPDQEIRNKRLFVNAGYLLPVHDRMSLEFNLTSNLQENSLSNLGHARIGNNTSSLLGEVTLSANPTDDLNLLVGYVQEDRTNYDAPSDHFQSIPDYEYWPRSAYAQGDYTIKDTVKLIAGTQWNESPLGDSDFISRAGVIVTPSKHWGIKLLRGEAFRGPITVESDLYDPPTFFGNDQLKAETITTYDTQLFYRGQRTYAAVTYFHSDIDKIITYDFADGVASYTNGGEQRFEGIELEAKHVLVSNWHLLGSFMHQENTIDEGLNPSVVPENMLKLGTDYTWESGSVGVFCSHFGKPPDTASPLVVNPAPEAVSLVSLNVRLDVSRCFGLDKGQSILTLRAENLLDEEIYVPNIAAAGSPNSFPFGPGRTIYIGLMVTF